jgi:Tol biopolymer transport system component/DNA-binding winged helix-turn-helix (wHTH) protein
MKDVKNRFYRFGNIEIDVQNLRVTVGSEIRPLEPKSFRLLLFLAENPGRVLPKDEIITSVWPGTAVSDNSLTRAITQVRKALDDDPKTPRYIETVPTVGYRFLGNCKEEQKLAYRFVERVREVGADGSRDNVPLETTSIQGVGVTREDSPGFDSLKNQLTHPGVVADEGHLVCPAVPWRLILRWAIPGFVVVTAAIVILFMRGPNPANAPLLVRVSLELPELIIRQEEKSGNSVALSSAVMSPDGTRIVYTGHGPDGVSRLYTRTLDQEQSLPLPGTEDAYGPFFSPDGKNVGFFAEGKFKKTSVEQGGATTLSDAPKGYGGSWGDDGIIVISPDVSSPLSLVSPSTGETRQITVLKAEAKDLAHIWPQVLPRAKAVLFTVLPSSANPDDASIEVQSLQTGERKTIARQAYFGRYAPSGHLLYMQGSTLFAAPMDLQRLVLTGPGVPIVQQVATSPFSYSAQLDLSGSGTLIYFRAKAAKQELVWLDAAGRTRLLRPAAAEYNPGVRFSPNGKRIALSLVEDDNVDVWVYDWERDAMTRLTTNGYAWLPVWSPDGNHVAFTSGKDGGAPNVYYMRADGSSEIVRLTNSEYRQIPFSFSPDGKRLAFVQFGPQTKADIWILPLEDVGTDHPKPGRPEPFLVTSFDERTPMISPDGQWLAYQSEESGRTEVWVRPFPGPGSKWQVSFGGGDRPVWSRAGPILFYRSTHGMMAVNYTADHGTFVAEKPRLWSPKNDLGSYFDPAPDGTRFAVLQPAVPDQSGSERVIMLQNFLDELRRRVPERELADGH